MINSYLFLLIFSIDLACPDYSKDSFAGVISYEISIEPVNKKIEHALLVENYGTGQKIYFRNGNYRISFEGGSAQWEIFRSDTNKQYVKFSNNEHIVVYDAGDESRDLKSFNIRDSSTKILERKTKVIEIVYEDNSISRYWYDPCIYLNPEPFKNLDFAYLNKYWEHAKAPYLKHERVTPASTVVYTATDIKKVNIAPQMFVPWQD